MQPQRLNFVTKSRQIVDKYPLKLPLPNIDPNFISFLSAIFGLFFLVVWQLDFPQKIPISFTCLVIALVLDWLDGLIARKWKRLTGGKSHPGPEGDNNFLTEAMPRFQEGRRGLIARKWKRLTGGNISENLKGKAAQELVARKYKTYFERDKKISSEKGWIADVMADRFCEIFIFLPFFFPWFYFALWNILLSFVSYLTKKHIILPLRFCFLVYFILKFLV